MIVVNPCLQRHSRSSATSVRKYAFIGTFKTSRGHLLTTYWPRSHATERPVETIIQLQTSINARRSPPLAHLRLFLHYSIIRHNTIQLRMGYTPAHLILRRTRGAPIRLNGNSSTAHDVGSFASATKKAGAASLHPSWTSTVASLSRSIQPFPPSIRAELLTAAERRVQQGEEILVDSDYEYDVWDTSGGVFAC